MECTESERKVLLDEIAYPKQQEQAKMREPRDPGAVGKHGHSFFSAFRDLTASGFWSSKMGIEDLQYRGNTFVAEWKGPPPEVLARLGLTEK